MTINVKRWYSLMNYNNSTYLILLVLSTLHYEKKITDAKLKGQIRALRAGTLQRVKNTHHCDITDRWYNNDSVYEIFEDVITLKGVNTIPFKEFIKYISLFENKGYNYAVNTFGIEYIYPLFQNWNPEYNDDNFGVHIQFQIEGIKGYTDGYNCYECGSYHSTTNKNVSSNIELLNEWLHTQKKGNKMRIPRYDVRNNTSVSMYGFDC